MLRQIGIELKYRKGCGTEDWKSFPHYLLLHMKTTYDKKADAYYIYFQNGKGKVSRTIQLQDFLMVDIGKKGKLYGIEILNASQHIAVKTGTKNKLKKVAKT